MTVGSGAPDSSGGLCRAVLSTRVTTAIQSHHGNPESTAVLVGVGVEGSRS